MVGAFTCRISQPRTGEHGGERSPPADVAVTASSAPCGSRGGKALSYSSATTRSCDGVRRGRLMLPSLTRPAGTHLSSHLRQQQLEDPFAVARREGSDRHLAAGTRPAMPAQRHHYVPRGYMTNTVADTVSTKHGLEGTRYNDTVSSLSI